MCHRDPKSSGPEALRLRARAGRTLLVRCEGSAAAAGSLGVRIGEPETGSMQAIGEIHLKNDLYSGCAASVLIHRKRIPEVLECHYTTGDWSILIKILCKDNEHLMNVLNKSIQDISGVSRTETFISLNQQLDRQIKI